MSYSSNRTGIQIADLEARVGEVEKQIASTGRYLSVLSYWVLGIVVWGLVVVAILAVLVL